MDENLKVILEKDEKVLWQGKPGAFKVLDITHKAAFIKKAVITACVAAAFIVFYFLANKGDFKPVVVLVPIVCGAYIVLNDLLEARKVRKASYFVTDKRLIVLKGDTSSAVYADIPCAALRKDSDGHSTLLCGERAMKAAPNKWRGLSGAGVINNLDTKLCDSLVMYNVEDPETLREVLKPYLTLN